MKPPGAIRWSQGMFLQPQHFQQSDLFHSSQMRRFAAALHPFPWGVRDLRVDVDALENEIFRVPVLDLVYPDGRQLQFPDAAELKESSFKDAFPPTLDLLGVYACIATLEAGDRLDRYVSRSGQCRDLYDWENEATVEYVVPKAELMFSNDPEDRRFAGLMAVRIAEIERTGLASPRYRVSPRYFPPLLRSDASTVLINSVRQVFDQICGAARLLGQYRRERGHEGLAYGMGDLEQLLALQLVNQFIPELQHLLAHGGGHPFDLYRLLVSLRGALTTYSPDAEAVEFPEYVHTNLAPCFLPVTESIRALLDRLLPTHYDEIRLERTGESFWGLIDEPLLTEGGPFVLAVRGPGSADELRQRVLEKGKISSISDVGHLITYGLRGVSTRHLDLPPAELPRLPDYTYFMIETGHATWNKVRQEKDFSFYLPDVEPEVDARLFVVLPRGRAK